MICSAIRPYAALFAVPLLLLTFAVAQDTSNPPKWEIFSGPNCAQVPEWNAPGAPSTCTAEQSAAWLKDMQHWRAERRIRVGYDGSQYNRPELKWTQSSFVQPQMMIHDRYFYDPSARRYTVDRYLNDVKQRYGGIDSVLVWPTYPNIGVDDRSQYDLFADMPGGVQGIKQMVDEFHQRGVRVLFPIMLWDQGTRTNGESDAERLTKQFAAVNADGLNGDTMDGVPLAYRTASDKTGVPLALEPELGPAYDDMVAFNQMTWGYWHYNFVPSVSRYKWMETRHMVHISNRWAHNHLDDLQHAFFNGTGFESWENVWSIWNQITPRDAEALRRIATIERAFPGLLVSEGWEPHTPTLRFGIFASKWPGEGRTLWTVVNRNRYGVNGRQLTIPFCAGARYFDVWHGVEIQPEQDGQHVTLAFDMESEGYGAILEVVNEQQAPDELLATMHKLSERPLQSYSDEWKAIPQQATPIAATAVPKPAPAGMTKIPAGDFIFRVNGIEIEGMNDEGVDVQYPWEDSARRYHEQKLHLKAYYIDTYPVTNAEFKRFLDAAHYRPADTHNFLKDWKDGNYPKGWSNKPVTWVSLEDARAYAQWAGKRLPHEWEWQYAAQGTDGRTYPWGNQWDKDAVPAHDTGREMKPASDVNAHPKGASPFGVMDLVGNVWQWTDEFTDEHTRSAVVRGGSHYRPEGSRWYFPDAFKLSEHGKYLLMAPSIDRSGSIGFRCAVDAE